MKLRNLKFLLLPLFLSTATSGQIPANASAEEQRRIEQRRQMEERRRHDESFARLRRISERRELLRENTVYGAPLPSGLPKPSEKDRQAIAVAEDTLTTYGEFLKQKNTGVFRLHDASGCDEEKYVINVDSACPNAYPGKATAYSFRLQSYQWKPYSDIFLEDSKLHVRGFHMLGIISSLGDQSLDNLTLSSDGVKQLFEIEPPEKMEDLQKYSNIIANGVQVGNYIYSNKAQLKSGQTYLLRVIAFKGSSVSGNHESFARIVLRNDKRKDILVVFKAVRENEDKSWDILWKELARKDAPKINL